MLFRGFLPRLYQATMQPRDLYSAYFATYVERYVRRLINVKDISKFETFIRLLAGRVGQLVNLSSLGGDVVVSSTTLGGWLSGPAASFVVIRLHNYHATIGKRLVKTPKLYFTEPGLLAWRLQIKSTEQVARNPLLGGIFENLVIVEAFKAGATVVPEMMKNLQRYRSLHGSPAGAALPYGGDGTASVDGIKFLPYTQVSKLLFNDR